MDDILYTFPDRAFADWDTLHGLLAQSFAAMEARIDPPSSMTQLTPALLRDKAAEELLLTARSGDRLVGTAFVKPHTDWAYVGKVAVAVDMRRRGISRRIFEIISAHGLAAGWRYVELQVRVELTENHATFGAFGYLKTGESAHPGYDRPTSWTMRKSLTPARA